MDKAATDLVVESCANHKSVIIPVSKTPLIPMIVQTKNSLQINLWLSLSSMSNQKSEGLLNLDFPFLLHHLRQDIRFRATTIGIIER